MPNIREQMDSRDTASNGAGKGNRQRPNSLQRERDSPPPEAPMSPMGYKLKSVHAAAREGKISAEQKARFKEELISDHRKASAATSESKRQQHRSKPPRSGKPGSSDSKRSKNPVSKKMQDLMGQSTGGCPHRQSETSSPLKETGTGYYSGKT